FLGLAVGVVLMFGLTQAAQAAFIGNKASKFYFPDSCSYAKMIKKENVVKFKTAAQAVKAGYKASSKCSDKK
ncbi:MAG: hypothetical protein KGJ11_06235, partial [Candidatus Omnitrophica bacterium]|nr:hypothetical protein [Candidatus Omnitrophota bacterium]